MTAKIKTTAKALLALYTRFGVQGDAMETAIERAAVETGTPFLAVRTRLTRLIAVWDRLSK